MTKYTCVDIMRTAGVQFSQRSAVMDFSARVGAAWNNGFLNRDTEQRLSLYLTESMDSTTEIMVFTVEPKERLATYQYLRIGKEVFGIVGLPASQKKITVKRCQWGSNSAPHYVGDPVFLKTPSKGQRYGTVDAYGNETYSQDEVDILVAALKASDGAYMARKQAQRENNAELAALRKTWGWKASQAYSRGRKDFTRPPQTYGDEHLYLQYWPQGQFAAEIIGKRQQSEAQDNRAMAFRRAHQNLQFAEDQLDREQARVVGIRGAGIPGLSDNEDALASIISEAEEDVEEAHAELMAIEGMDTEAETPDTRKSRILAAMESYTGPFNKRSRPRLKPFRTHVGIPDITLEERNALWNQHTTQ